MTRGARLATFRDSEGAVAIESAIVAPVLLLMALGVFQVGSMVSRQQELQSGASDVTAIILAAATSSGTGSNEIEAVIEDSLDLQPEEVTLLQRFRCGSNPTLDATPPSCPTGTPVHEYVLLQLTDTYTPLWARYGVGAPFTYTVNRTIQIR